MYTEFDTPEKCSAREPNPIYINLLVDITYRGKYSCKRGDAFKIDHIGPYNFGTEPLAATPTFAVDIIAMRRACPIANSTLHDDKSMLQKLVANLCDGHPTLGVAEQVLACVKKGLKELILVAGNNGLS
jgi:hypothetical protein